LLTYTGKFTIPDLCLDENSPICGVAAKVYPVLGVNLMYWSTRQF